MSLINAGSKHLDLQSLCSYQNTPTAIRTGSASDILSLHWGLLAPLPQCPPHSFSLPFTWSLNFALYFHPWPPMASQGFISCPIQPDFMVHYLDLHITLSIFFLPLPSLHHRHLLIFLYLLSCRLFLQQEMQANLAGHALSIPLRGTIAVTLSGIFFFCFTSRKRGFLENWAFIVTFFTHVLTSSFVYPSQFFLCISFASNPPGFDGLRWTSSSEVWATWPSSHHYTFTWLHSLTALPMAFSTPAPWSSQILLALHLNLPSHAQWRLLSASYLFSPLALSGASHILAQISTWVEIFVQILKCVSWTPVRHIKLPHWFSTL